MDDPRRRKWPRYPVRVPIWCAAGDDERSGRVVDLSVGGCFVEIDRPEEMRPEGERVLMRLDFGDDGPLVVNAVVRHAANPNHTGFGAEFVGLDAASLDRISRHLSTVLTGPSTRRTGPRVPAVAKARYRGLNVAYAEARTADVSEHGLFVVTGEALPGEGSLLEFVVDLPDGGPPLLVVGKVVRAFEEPADGKPRGMGVDLTDLDDAGRERLRTFVEHELARVIEETGD